jgi:hypothetical protein
MIKSARFITLCWTAIALSSLTTAPEALAQKQKQLTDEDILNPKKLVFNKVVTFADSFDNAPIGTIFVSKRAILGNPQVGVLGEEGSPRHKQACLLFCPQGTTEIDATYVYIIQKKGECTIGVRAIGWTEVKEDFEGGLFTGRTVEKGRVRHTGEAINIKSIQVNSKPFSPPLNVKEISGPHGTNYRYFPRNKNWLGSQTTASEGFITDIHFFASGNLKRTAQQGDSLTIRMPGWQPEQHVISGPQLEELRKLTNECDSD